MVPTTVVIGKALLALQLHDALLEETYSSVAIPSAADM